MSDLLGIGSSALRAYQTALSAVGENVANAQTPGYARRRVVLQEQSVNTIGDIGYRPQVMFNGVTAVGVARAWDNFKAVEARFAATADGRASVRQQWLGGIETALDDGASGVGQAMTGFFNAASSLASAPGDTLGRRAVLSSLDNVASAFRTSGQALARLSDGIGQAADIEIASLNDALKALAAVNGALGPAAANGSARASLEDQRDQLIDFIAAKIDVNVTTGDDGRVTITSASTGLSLLTGSGPNLALLVKAADGRLSLQLQTNGSTVPLPAAGGKLAGLVDVAQNVADRRAQLDSLATDFTAMVNGWSAAGVDANGNAGGALMSVSGGATSIQSLVTDPSLVAAASPSGTANGNLLALDAIRDTSKVEDRWGALVSANAQSLASANAEASATATWKDNSYAALDEVSGVDLDTEAAELLRFQQAYNASARIIQVARETIQALFDAL
ncbi:flagellar hook-associated protein FlgK [Allosphingosinicella sp.]|uniref:flagellar hook-associated protein FlgK n=1 Tax=Allosphingosinicella sp. TaxID=2823234 RepID=UPI003783CD50